MKKKEHKRSSLPKLFSFSPQLLMHGPQISIYAGEGCAISGILGIISYDDSEILLKTESGNLRILGKGLVIKEAGNDFFAVIGTIIAVFLGE